MGSPLTSSLKKKRKRNASIDEEIRESIAKDDIFKINLIEAPRMASGELVSKVNIIKRNKNRGGK